jgi:hypothetical protein
MVWVGQALIATRNGHHADSRMLFEHAVSLSADVVSQKNPMRTCVIADLKYYYYSIQARSRYRVLQTRTRPVPQGRAQPPRISKRSVPRVLRAR